MKQCKVIRGGAAFHGKQGLEYFAGVSAETSGSDGICMHLLVMPPGAEATSSTRSPGCGASAMTGHSEAADCSM